jgi:hypothetical protein
MMNFDEAALLSRRWHEARTQFRMDQIRVDLSRFDSLAKLVARRHRETCEQRCSRKATEYRRAA